MRQIFIGQRNLLGESSANTSGIWGLRDILTMRYNDYLLNPSDTAGIGVFSAGQISSGPLQNTIDYVTIATAGNATDFGDLYGQVYHLGAVASATRGVIGGDWGPNDRLDYITFASVGNSTNFGNLSLSRGFVKGCGDSTRGVFGGGYTGGFTDTIDYVTIASAGNATDFGNLTTSRYSVVALSSSVRGIFAGGTQSPSGTSNTIDYITIASTGNATDFGDTISGYPSMGCSSKIRGLLSGTSYTNTIEYITIAVLGNSVDFGDLSQARSIGAACSSNHGGI